MAADIGESENKSKTLKPVNGLTKRIAGDVFDEWKSLYGYTFTVGFLIESLRTNDEEYKRLHGNRPVKDVDAYNMSKGRGFCSRVLRCTVSFVDPISDSDVYTTILKVPGTEAFEELNEELGISYAIEEKTINTFVFFHQTEADFYNYLASTLDVPYPKVFKILPWIPGESQGALHMEDMTGKGIVTGFYPSMNITQIKEVVRYWAHMHKIVLTGDESHKELWKGKYNKNQLAYVSCTGGAVQYESLLDICKNREYFEPILKKYQKFSGSREYVEYACCQSWKDLNLEPVLAHGDLWGGNIMWKLDKNGEVSNEVAAFVDWQLMHEGSPMTDLVMLLIYSTDGAIRREAEEFIIEMYHDLLEKEMKEAGKSCPYTVEQLKESYNYMFLTQVYALVMFMKVCAEYFKNDTARLAESKIDSLILRCKHALEDMDRLLAGPLKHLMEKFGQ